MVTVSTLDPPCLPGDYHASTVERSSSLKAGVPCPLDRRGKIEDELGSEEEEERLTDAGYATAARSHRQGVRVFHGEQGDHFAQRFWNRCRTRIYPSHGLFFDEVLVIGTALTVFLSYVYECVVASVQVWQRDADNVYARVSRGINWTVQSIGY